jgi:hypothetical protein
MRLTDVDIEFTNGRLTCRGTVHARGATPQGVNPGGHPVSTADSFTLHAPEGGQLITDEGVTAIEPGDYLFHRTGVSFRGRPVGE